VLLVSLISVEKVVISFAPVDNHVATTGCIGRGVLREKIDSFVFDDKLCEDAATTSQAVPQGHGPVPNNIQVQRTLPGPFVVRLFPCCPPLQTQPWLPPRKNNPGTTQIEYFSACDEG
jgi:hypothetical protein